MPRPTTPPSADPRRARAPEPSRPSRAAAVLAGARVEWQGGRQAAALARLGALDPADAEAGTAAGIGRLLLDGGQAGAALPWLDRAVALAPKDAPALAARAFAQAALGRPAAALDDCARAAWAGAAGPEFHLLHGELLRAAGKREAAVASIDAALRLRPAFPEALRAGGAILREAGHPEGAARFLAEAARLDPADRAGALDLVGVLHGLGRFADMLDACEAALAARPADAGLLTNRGVALLELGRLPEARTAFACAVAADPDLAPAHLNLGNALVWFGEAGPALAAFERALALRPAYAEAQCGRGVALRMLGRFAEAAGAFAEALALDPASAHARSNRGELALLAGDMPGGWADYEFRFGAGRQVAPVLNRPVPFWDGAPLAPGTRLAVVADQGNGDIIHFARYLPLLVERGLDVTFLCPARLHRLLGPVTENLRVTDAVGAGEPLDLQVPLSSLPHRFGTGPGTIPAPVGYLRPEPVLAHRWAARIGRQGFRVGLCWRGSQHWQSDPRRTLPLAALAPLARVPGLRLFALQRPDEAAPDEAGALAALGIEPLGPELDTGPDGFVDTAAAMACLDAVVTCDTSAAHLAGALGVPAFVLLQAVPEWRWMTGRADSPWYAALRLVRQARPGDWTDPVEAVAGALRALAAR